MIRVVAVAVPMTGVPLVRIGGAIGSPNPSLAASWTRRLAGSGVTKKSQDTVISDSYIISE